MRVPTTIVVSVAVVILCAKVGYGWESACIQSITPNPACLGTQQSFTAGSGCTYPGTPVWDFGDGSHASGMSVTHTYTLSGSSMVVVETHHGRETATAVGYATVAEVMCIWEEPPGVFSETSEPGEDETIYVSNFWAEIDGISLGAPQEPWPAGEPEWDAGGGYLFDDPYNGAGYKIFYPSGPGWYTIRVSCGDSSKAIKICAIEVTVTADKGSTCVGGDVYFTANVTPSGLGNKTFWEADLGQIPYEDYGLTFDAYWTTAGVYQVRATVAGVVSATTNVTIACPVDFHFYMKQELSNGTLRPWFTWESSSRNRLDLQGLEIGEIVNHEGMGGDWFQWPEPWDDGESWYYERWRWDATNSSMWDDLQMGNIPLPPSTSGGFETNQVYAYRNVQRPEVGGVLLGPHTIWRHVYNEDGNWYYNCSSWCTSPAISMTKPL